MGTNRKKGVIGGRQDLFCLFLMALLFATLYAGATSNEQKQTPIQISSVHHLARIGNDDAYPLNGHYILATDIDASAATEWNGGRGLLPIGTWIEAPFTGVFDGQGHVIRNLNINRSDEDYVGLFGYIGTEGNIADLGVEGGTIQGKDCTGGLVGYSLGTIANSYTAVTVRSTGSKVGGLAGRSGSSGQRAYIQDCYSESMVAGNNDVGGLVGFNEDGEISSCYSSGEIESDGFGIGGLVGYAGVYSLIEMSYSDSDVRGGDSVGGLVGNHWYGTILQCFATGNVTIIANTSDNSAGGLVGKIFGGSAVIQQSYSIGTVSHRDPNRYEIYGGGLIGYFDRGSVLKCYSVGRVIGKGDVGGLTGLSYASVGDVSSSFWDMSASGQTASPDGIGWSTREMTQKENFAAWDWDFSAVWGIEEERSYPYLLWSSFIPRPDTVIDEGEAGEGEQETTPSGCGKSLQKNNITERRFNRMLADWLLCGLALTGLISTAAVL